jgi:hypothetical protein
LSGILVEKMLDDFLEVQRKEEFKCGEVDINIIIRKLGNYSKSELCLMRDCIDFMIIYKSFN